MSARLPRTRLGVLIAIVLGSGAGCGPAPTPMPPARPPVALAPLELTGVGDIPQGTASEEGLVIRATEVSPAAIRTGSGSFQITLTDRDGRPTTVSFTGTPTITGPGSLGATASLTSANVLTVQIVDSDTFNVEQITIEELGVRASESAALGAVNAVIGGCAGSLAGCTADNVLASPGTVVAAP